MKTKLGALGALMVTAAMSSAVAAPAMWTQAPIRLIVPASPGGSLDQLTRILGEELSRISDHPFIIENRGGGAGAVARQYVANGSQDGTVVLMGPVHETTRAALVKDVPIPMTDEYFDAVAMIGSVPNVLVVNPNVPAKSVAELVTLAKSSERKLDYGIGSIGNLQDMTGILFQYKTGADLVSVPYKGSGPAIVDLLGGQIQMLFETLPAALPHIESNKLRALAVTSPERIAVLPHVPTFKEAGVEGIELSTWYGMFVKRGTDDGIKKGLASLVAQALEAPNVQKAWKEAGLSEGPYPTGAKFAEFVAQEHQRWQELVKTTGISVEK